MQSGLYDYWMALYKRRLFILIVTFSSAFFALLMSVTFTPVYEAKSSFYLPIQSSGGQFASLQPGTQAADRVLLPIAEEKSASVNIGILKSKDMARNLIERFPHISLDQLQRNVDIKLSGEFLIEVYVRDLDPQQAAAIANAYPENYRQFHESNLRQRMAARRSAYQELLPSVSAALNNARESLARLQEGTDEVTPAIAEELVRDFMAVRDQARVELEATNKRIEQLKKQLMAERANYKLGEEVLTSPMIEYLEKEIMQLEIKLTGMKSLKQSQAELQALKGKLEQEFEQLINSDTKGPSSIHEELRAALIVELNQLKFLEAKRESAAQILAELAKGKRQFGKQYEQFQSEIDRLSMVKLQIEQQLVDAQVREESIAGIVIEVERAVPPDSHVFPKTGLNVLVALVLGFVVGCYYALLLHYLRALNRRRVMKKMDWSPISGDL